MKMVFRLATRDDISSLHNIRTAVKENVLSDPNRITPMDYREKLEVDGKGWLCEVEDEIAGFAIVDMKNKNIWALFVHPTFERKEIGKALFTMMVDWAFEQGIDKLWLTTAANTKASRLYESMDWQKTGLEKKGEVRFECTREMWQKFSLKSY
jgi:ribosomal protein S18 acetylase RimI-like enzyme